MINQQLALVRRELWEHRSIWVTPAAVATVVTLLAIAMVVAIAAFGEAMNADIGKIADMTAPRRCCWACYTKSAQCRYCNWQTVSQSSNRSRVYWMQSLPIRCPS